MTTSSRVGKAKPSRTPSDFAAAQPRAATLTTDGEPTSPGFRWLSLPMGARLDIGNRSVVLEAMANQLASRTPR